MHFSYSSIASIIAGLHLVSATPATSLSRLQARVDSGACGKAAAAASAYAKANPKANNIYISAQTAYDCLKSVPLKKDPAVELTRALKPYAQLQSSIDYLRNPPSGYLWDPVDVPRLLDAIETKLISRDTYTGEYDFQTDLQTVYMKARDGHFYFNGDLINAFTWVRPMEVSLVSLSLDGKQLPQVYLTSDVIGLNGSKLVVKKASSASAVKTINGIEVEKFLLAEANSELSSDPDNSWNTRFYNIRGLASKLSMGGFTQPWLYPGPKTTIELQNGTVVDVNNMAVPKADLDGIATGEDMYEHFCTPITIETDSPFEKRDLTSLTPRQTVSSNIYPTPDFVDTSGVLSGYYLDDDVAVMVISSFVPGKGEKEEMLDFQDTVTAFFADAVKKGVSKLIIDLQGNGGGSLDLCIDLIAQLFPTVPPNSKDNMRTSPGMYSIMLAASNAAANADKLSAADDAEIDFTTVPFSFQEVMTPDVKKFNRLEDYYGPNHIGNGFFTNYFQGNYTNDDPSEFGLPGIVITGTNDRKGFKQPFKAENIITVTDGYCGSACTILSEHLKRQGVQSIALGGRLQTGPMQAVGGTKGSQVFQAGNLAIMVDLLNNSTLNTNLKALKGTLFEHFSTLPIGRSDQIVALNGRNQFRIGDDTQTPLQFVYEAADCRMFYTPEMAASPVPIWDRVSTLAFENRKNGVIDSPYCVKDSTKHATSLGGGVKAGNGSIGPQTPPSSAKSKVTGFLINGKDIVNGLASGLINDNSPVDASVATTDGVSTTTDTQVVAAVETWSPYARATLAKNGSSSFSVALLANRAVVRASDTCTRYLFLFIAWLGKAFAFTRYPIAYVPGVEVSIDNVHS